MGRKVFLVEDNAASRLALSETLGVLSGAEIVGWSDNQVDALDALGANSAQWSAAVVDLSLARGSGLEVVKQLASRDPSRKVIVMSNHATEEMKVRCISEGADRVFDKSNEIGDLVSYVRSL